MENEVSRCNGIHQPYRTISSVRKLMLLRWVLVRVLRLGQPASTSAKNCSKTSAQPNPDFWTNFQFNLILLGRTHLLSRKPLTYTRSILLRYKGTIGEIRAFYAHRLVLSPNRSILSSEQLSANWSSLPIDWSNLSINLISQLTLPDRSTLCNQSINSLRSIDQLSWSSIAADFNH